MVQPAWEQTALASPNVLVCIATVGDVSYEWACAFADLWAVRVPGTMRRKLGPYTIDLAREHGALDAVSNGFKWLFFLDSDVIVPQDTIHRLLQHNQPIVSGFYARRHPPIHPLLLRRGNDGNFGLVTNFSQGELVEVDLCPSGCLLISTEVFKRVPRPWFFYTDGRVIDIGGQSIQLPNGTSEDYFFSLRSKSYGFKVLVDTSLKVRHKGYFNILPRDDGGYEMDSEVPNP